MGAGSKLQVGGDGAHVSVPVWTGVVYTSRVGTNDIGAILRGKDMYEY